MSPYISEKTQFQLEEFQSFQCGSVVYNKDLFYLSFQTEQKLQTYASFQRSKIVFEDYKKAFLIRKVKKQIGTDNSESKQGKRQMKHLKMFESLNHRYVWLAHSHDNMYLDVIENEDLDNKGVKKKDKERSKTSNRVKEEGKFQIN